MLLNKRIRYERNGKDQVYDIIISKNLQSDFMISTAGLLQTISKISNNTARSIIIYLCYDSKIFNNSSINIYKEKQQEDI